MVDVIIDLEETRLTTFKEDLLEDPFLNLDAIYKNKNWLNHTNNSNFDGFNKKILVVILSHNMLKLLFPHV